MLKSLTMITLAILLLHLTLLGTRTFCAELPSYIQLCKKSDPDVSKCMVNSFDALFPYMIKGIPELNYPPIDPLHCRNLSLTLGQASVQIHADLANGVLTGLGKARAEYSHLNFSTATFITKVVIPEVKLKGLYRFKGKILLFEIDGDGAGEFNATDLSVVFTQFGEYYNKNGARYIRFKKTHFTTEMGHMSLYLADLFKNNELLTQSVNQAINDNIESLKNELEQIIGKNVEDIILSDYIKIYDMFPVDVLFPD
uniref:Uncharacterized protein n=1 Tax=Photinus pyralis TaxID=7054 RepID=A0A1Y1MN43_PHOPY